MRLSTDSLQFTEIYNSYKNTVFGIALNYTKNDAYANTAIEDERVMNAICSVGKKSPWRRSLVAIAAAAVLLSTILAAGAAADWSFFSGLFKDTMNGPITVGDYRGRLRFEEIDYENAQTVELRFGDTVIPLK